MEYNKKTNNGKFSIYGFATYPDVVMYDSPSGKTAVQHLIFGDYINLLPNKNQMEPTVHGDRVFVRSRRENGWVKKSSIQKERILEINFVDIGQGDGCHIVTPNDKHLIVDAGQGDNMFRFLSWRFNLRKSKNRISDINAIITHPDADHYKGFNNLFSATQLSFSKVYHNGIIERANHPVSVLGNIEFLDGEKYLSETYIDDTSLKDFLNNRTGRGKKWYSDTLYKALDNNPEVCFQMLHNNIQYLPGFEGDGPLNIQILGPVCRLNPNGKVYLKYLSSASGKVKNGHSVSIMLRIGRLSVFLGGDLNIEAENFLLSHYSGKDVKNIKTALKKEKDPIKREKFQKELDEVVLKASKIYRADIAKACHHGSHHFTTEFLKAINPIATIISSGDDESHAHPRPDALGAFGKCSRGERPLIFSTELARSSKETIKKPNQYRKSVRAVAQQIKEEDDLEKQKKLQKSLDKLLKLLERSVTVYGMINIRTDGERVIICQKLEKPRAANQKWDIHELIYNNDLQDFEYKFKH